MVNGSCSGMGCCEATVPFRSKNYFIMFDESKAGFSISNFNTCQYAVFTEVDRFKFSTSYLTKPGSFEKDAVSLSVVLDWTISSETCKLAQRNVTSYACVSSHSTCINYSGLGYRCSCAHGYKGNPYLPGGCLGVSICIVVVLLSSTIVYRIYQRRIVATIKQNYFQQYGGHLLLEQMKSEQGFSFRLFKEEELNEATSNFDAKNVVGEGGNGTVYKGTMNNRFVAIKKCKTIGERARKEFGKEILILSQINHKNIVRIVGCCVEVEIPILVYEFISEGTLFDLLHGKKVSHIPLCTRLRIAQEAAEALDYLHSWASPPIVHRDVKTSNILLDENFIAKVSDFGACVLALGGDDQFVTHVQGTRGYLDPEYVQTGQLTVKSDVYSFGIVLLELLTRRKAFYMEVFETRSLAADFLSAMKENNVGMILDDEIAGDGEIMGLITSLTELVRACLHMEGERRPEMRQIVAALGATIRAIGNLQLQE
ncbi:hypothetical protein LUZ61_004867 [Rhynchospora tenuis]|uniref:Protein kinase domain-containing protein n=1 Tax=Rhynchospora tenuis TaxID=198213 RepID=A0AAD5ZNJ2_9POAL|nr:hypothetical protein LUZ61_004867 [Rhynchospora tenuis]